MSHLKKAFKFHNYFDNKFSEQTYLAYLCRDKKRYVIRSGDYIPRFIIDTIDFIIRCNNAIARRGSVQNAIDNIKQLYIKSGPTIIHLVGIYLYIMCILVLTKTI